MEEIYYPDGTLGLVSEKRIKELREVKSNPDLNVVNPKEGSHRASSKHNILVNIGGQPLKIKIGLWKIDTKDIHKSQEKKMRDPQGKIVYRKEYDAMTGNDIDKRGTRYKNEDGQEVSSDDIRWFVDTPDGEKEITKFEKTDDIQITFKPAGTEDAYIFKDTYEVVPDTEEDRFALWELVKKLKENNEVAIGLVVHSKSWDKYGIIFVPYVDEKSGKFSLLGKTTSKKFGLSKPQDIPTGKIEKKKKTEAPTSAEELFT